MEINVIWGLSGSKSIDFLPVPVYDRKWMILTKSGRLYFKGAAKMRENAKLTLFIRSLRKSENFNPYKEKSLCVKRAA